MRPPLIRAGEGPAAAYAAAHTQAAASAARIAGIVTASGTAAPDRAAPTAYTMGDAHQLRGIPAVGGKGGIGGAIPGTRPGA